MGTIPPFFWGGYGRITPIFQTIIKILPNHFFKSRISSIYKHDYKKCILIIKNHNKCLLTITIIIKFHI